jgi:hypothetical protein
LAIAFIRRLLGPEGQVDLIQVGFGDVRQDVDVDIVRAEGRFVLAEAQQQQARTPDQSVRSWRRAMDHPACRPASKIHVRSAKAT